MPFRDWAVWQLDWPTLWVYFMLAQFFAYEWLTSGSSPLESWQGQMVTDHFRAVAGTAPVIWFIVLGLWLWIGPHILAPALEAWLIKKGYG